MEENIYRVLETDKEVIDLKRVIKIRKDGRGLIVLIFDNGEKHQFYNDDLCLKVLEQYRMFLKTSLI